MAPAFAPHIRALTKGAEWWDTQDSDDHDLYIFTHGHDYRGALSDYVQVRDGLVRPCVSSTIAFLFSRHLPQRRRPHCDNRHPTPFSDWRQDCHGSPLHYRCLVRQGGYTHHENVFSMPLSHHCAALFPRYTPNSPRWTRWYDLNNIDVKKLVNEYRSRALPLYVGPDAPARLFPFPPLQIARPRAAALIPLLSNL